MKLPEELSYEVKYKDWNLASRFRLIVLPFKNFIASVQHLGFTAHLGKLGDQLHCKDGFVSGSKSEGEEKPKSDVQHRQLCSVPQRSPTQVQSRVK